MKSSSVVSCLVALLALFLVSNVNSVASAKPVDSIEEAINSAPIRDLRKLGNKATAAAALSELNKFYGQHVVNQKAVLKAKVEVANATAAGRNDFQIRAAKSSVKLKGGGESIDVLNWFYFPESGAPAAAGVAVGSDITVSGIVRRCEIVSVNGTLQINFDLVESKVEKRPDATR